MITAKQYTETYVRYRDSLQANAERISKSSETRKYLIQNADTAPFEDLLQEAIDCIYNLTGDVCFKKQVTEAIERRKHEAAK